MFKRLFGENEMNKKAAKEMAGNLLRAMDKNYEEMKKHYEYCDATTDLHDQNVRILFKREKDGLTYSIYPVIPESKIVKHDSTNYKYYKTSILTNKIKYDRSTEEGAKKEVEAVERLCLNSIISEIKVKRNKLFLKFGDCRYELMKGKLDLIETINTDIADRMPWA